MRSPWLEPGLPFAALDGPSRELRLLVDHREDLVRDRTAHINRLRWHLHELDPSWDPSPRCLIRFKHLGATAARLQGIDTAVARIARDLVGRIRGLTEDVNELEREIAERAAALAPNLLALAGVGALTAAKIVAETADVRRFRSKDAFARHNGTAPLPVWSGNRVRHRLSRTGNRQLNAATPDRGHPDADPRRCEDLPGAADDERRHQDRGAPGPEAEAVRRRLPSASGRR